MKKVKRTVSLIITAALLFSLIPSMTINVSAITSGDWTYTENGDSTTITITKYSGSEETVVIPTSIDGKTVNSIEGSSSSAGILPSSNTTTKSITIPNSVTYIGDYAFYRCESLTTVPIPNSVTYIGDYAFQGCTSLTTVTIPNSVTYIGEWTFASCGITTITIPNSVLSIGDYAFWSCTSLTTITIPNSVTSIGDAAFLSCTSLTTITIPNSVTSIGDAAFSNCTSLTTITIPNSVTSIGDGAFSDCTSLTTAYFKHSNASKITTFPKKGTYGVYGVFDDTAKIIYPADSIGFSTPKWKGYPAEPGEIPTDPIDPTEPTEPPINISPLKLTPDYVTETMVVTKSDDSELDQTELALYSYVVEVGGRVKSIEALYGDTLNISTVIPKNASKPVKIAIVNANAPSDYSKKGLLMFAFSDVMSNTVTIPPRGSRITRTEITIDYANEVITGTGTYDYKTNLGEWQTITFSDTSVISISNFRMGGVITFRRSASALNSAGLEKKIKIRSRPKPPDTRKIRVTNGVLGGVSDKMEYSNDGVIWKTASEKMPVTEVTTDKIYFRVKATDKSMKSLAVEYY